jgi:threonine dehydratase
MRLLFSLANVKADPTGSLAVGALLTKPDFFRNHRVCCIISGGNVDPEIYRRILAGLS